MNADRILQQFDDGALTLKDLAEIYDEKRAARFRSCPGAGGEDAKEPADYPVTGESSEDYQHAILDGNLSGRPFLAARAQRVREQGGWPPTA